MQLGLLLAVATAVTSMLGFLYKHRGAVLAPEVEFRRPLRSTFVLFRSGWYTLGIVVALGSWFLHVGALALAPISVVQSVIAGGLVLLTVFADRIFGFTVTRREWIGVALAALGLAFLAATLEGGAESAHSDYDAAGIATYIGLTIGAGLAVAAVALRPGAGAGGAADGSTAGDRGSTRRHHAGIMLGISAGLLWAGSDIAIKGASGHFDEGLALALNPLAWVMVIASLVGLLVSARSLQLGEAVPVIAVTSVTANTVTIAAGPIVFGDPLPDEAFGVVLRIAAFALVIAAAAMTPLPAPATLPVALEEEA